MSEPRTLLQMAGITIGLPRLSEAALIVIDAQGEYRSGALPLEGIDPAADHIARLLDHSRSVGLPVLHIAHRGSPGGLFDRSGPGGAILPEAHPLSGETVIEKGLPNAFAGTNLHEALEKLGRRHLILAGFMTHMCVSSTARAALDLGYKVTVAGDATATRALPSPLGGTAIPACQLQDAALAALADRFADIVSTGVLVETMKLAA